MYAETKMAKTRRQIRRADFAMTNLIKFTESVKSVNIHLVWRNFVNSNFRVTSRISGHKWSFLTFSTFL